MINRSCCYIRYWSSYLEQKKNLSLLFNLSLDLKIKNLLIPSTVGSIIWNKMSLCVCLLARVKSHVHIYLWEFRQGVPIEEAERVQQGVTSPIIENLVSSKRYFIKNFKHIWPPPPFSVAWGTPVLKAAIWSWVCSCWVFSQSDDFALPLPTNQVFSWWQFS